MTGSYSASLRANGQSGTPANVQEYTISAADTWEHKKITCAYTGGDTLGDLLVDFGLGKQTSKTTSTLGTWQTTNFVFGNNQVDWQSNSGATFYLTGIQLEVGEQATPFEHRSFGDELARCQRYAYVPTKTLALTGQSGGFLGRVIYPVTMRSAPALTLTASAGYDNSSSFGNSPEANEFTITNVNSGNGVSFSTPPTGMIITEQTKEECMIGFSGASTPNEEAQNPIYSVKFGTGAFMLLIFGVIVMDEMNISSAQYVDARQENINCVIGGVTWCVPNDPDNVFFAEIQRQVEAGDLTILDAD